MRDFKFRGKSISHEKFVYGSLVCAADGFFIVDQGTNMAFEEPDYHKQGMGCGLEDRNITDRYEAMAHGFECAIEKCAEAFPSIYEVVPESVGQFINLVDANGKEIYEGCFCKSGQNSGIIEYNPDILCYILRRADNTFIRLDVIKKLLLVYSNPELLTP